MDFKTFVERVVDDGIAAARRDYCRPDQAEKLHGSLAGFEACRGQSVTGLRDLLKAATTAVADARARKAEDYWWYRCYEAEVEWTCNVVSACLHDQGLPVIVSPTARGFLAAARIVGVRAASG